MMMGVLAVLTALGQGNDVDCPSFRNTTSFNTYSPLFSWSARVGERVSTSSFSDTTTGYYVMSTCADPNAASITGHNNIVSSTLNSGPDDGINCCSHGSFWDANDRRFQIITAENAGIDQFTVNGAGTGMPRIPEGYTSSIRLGDPHATGQSGYTSHTWTSGNNKGAEALFYTMYVTTMNAMLFVNYAVVGRCYDHSTYQAGEFLIRVVKRNDDGTWPNAPINDSLWFKISAPPIPSSGVPAAPWQMGRPGSICRSTTCAYVYKPWTKVGINLNKYIGKTVRIEMYTSDCIYAVDPIYAYISGDFQPMLLLSTGCPAPESEVVDTIVAPEGMLSYRWYVSTRGYVGADHLNTESYMDTVAFRQVYPLEGTTDDHRYEARLEDFILTEGPHAGDTVGVQTFKCVMTSAMDPSKPFESKIYANIYNRKPNIGYLVEPHCDRSVSFINNTVSYNGMLDDSATSWVVYADTLGMEPLDTLRGDYVTYAFPSAGRYSARLTCTTDNDPCTSTKLFVFDVYDNPPADFTVSADVICESDLLTLQANDGLNHFPGVSLQWSVDDSLLADTTALVQMHLDVGAHTLQLTATTPQGCSQTATRQVTVYGQPFINISSDGAAICLGDSVTLSSEGNISYSWNAVPYDPVLDSVQGQSSFVVHPTVTTTYYLLPVESNPCSVEGAAINVEVIPYPTPAVRSSSERVNMDHTTVSFQDVSAYSARSYWAFSDGGSAEGSRVTHAFTDLGGDSVSITLHTCNRLDCCVDTTFSLPVEVTTVWFPNTFMPDSDNGNNRFGVHTSLTLIDYEIFIYNRQGMLVHSSTDPQEPWDGTLDATGGPAPQGAYVWFCRYAYSPDFYHTLRGTVTLLR